MSFAATLSMENKGVNSTVTSTCFIRKIEKERKAKKQNHCRFQFRLMAGLNGGFTKLTTIYARFIAF